MPNAHDIAHLVGLIQAAQAEADRIGADAAGPAEHLEQALSAAQALSPGGASADEGVRVEDLTTGNDK